jgi:tetratricopeptide (TPR) repeat protein
MAYKVKIVKWVLIGLIWLSGSFVLLRADAADLYAKGTNALATRDYTTAAQSFDQIIKNYPSTPNMDDVRMRAGLAYYSLGDLAAAVDRFAKERAPDAPAASRPIALYYTGLAQLAEGVKAVAAPAKAAPFFQQAVTTLSDLITLANQDYQEEAYYNRALAYYYENDLGNAEKDLQQVLLKFPDRPSVPDYRLLLGRLYAQQASQAVAAKKSNEDVTALANKAIGIFDQVISDPDALIQANEAAMAKAEVLYLLASLTPTDASGFQKAVDAFRQVRRKEDLIGQQQKNLDALRQKNQASLLAAQTGFADKDSRIVDREAGQLADLKNGPDPIIQALIRIAECYNYMKQGDESRTVLHRLANATLTADQHQEVDLALINSYVLGGQADKADKALTDYLAKHPGDPQAQGISIQIGNTLLRMKDNAGALAQANRSLKDFPQGRNVGSAIALKVAALSALGRFQEADAAGEQFLHDHPQSPEAIDILFSAAERKAKQGDLNGALADYQKVRDTATAPDLQAGGDAGYIQTLQALGRLDDVISESKAFAAKFPTSPVLPSILVMGAVAMDQKHDPGAIAALQAVAQQFPKDDPGSPAPFALFYIVNIYQRTATLPGMVQATADLQKAFPTQYAYLLQAEDMVSAAYVKEKQFDQAAAAYQYLANAPKPDVAAMAQDKIGEVWVDAAQAMGAYQSMQVDTERAEAQKRLGAAEDAFLGVLKNSSDQLAAVDEAFKGLDDVLLRRRSWGVLKQADFEAYLTKITAGLTDPAMQTRLELAKAGLVFLDKNGAKQYPAALARFRAAIAANPSLVLTSTEATRYGELLLDAKDYATAEQVYTTLLNSDLTDPYTQADGDYGLGALYLAQGELDKAQVYFAAMKKLPGGAGWNPHILDANYGLALVAEQSGQPGDLDAAQQAYAAIMQAPEASVELQAKSMLGYGRVLEKQGHTTAPAVAGSIEYAVHYYQQVDTLYGPAVPELSAEGLFDAGLVYDKAGDKASALKQYQALEANYKTTAPDWVAKAQAAELKDK